MVALLLQQLPMVELVLYKIETLLERKLTLLGTMVLQLTKLERKSNANIVKRSSQEVFTG
jgi:hypothetical protein